MAEQKPTRARRSKTTAPTEQELGTPMATPAIVQPLETPTGSVRRAIDSTVPSMASPLATLARMTRARNGDARAAVELIEPLLQQDLTYSAAVDTVIEALTSALLIAEPAGERARDQRLCAEVQTRILDTEPVRNIVEHLATMDDFGYALAENIWDTTTTPWTIADVRPINPAWVTFDKNDARTPRLLPAESNALPADLVWGKFVYAALPGYSLPYLRSHGYAAAFFKALASMSMKDWAGFLEMFGQPMRKGTYDPTAIANPAELAAAKKVLRKALENLAADAWAMLPKGLEIELLESTTKGMSSDLYERFIRYIDELITKRKTGSVLATGTGNTGSGGTQALGSVHNEALLRKVRSLARRVAGAIRSGIVEPYVRLNYGPDTPVPFVRFSFEEQEDIAAFSQALGTLVPLGLEVSQEEVRDRLGLRAPTEGEALLGMAKVPAVPADAAAPTKQENSHQARSRFAAEETAGAHGDELDNLLSGYLADDGYTRAEADLNEALLSAISTAKTADDLVQALAAFAGEANVDSMRDHLTGLMLTARAAGEMGVDIGGK